jgi:hypothetical protein
MTPEPPILGQQVFYIRDDRLLEVCIVANIEDRTDPNTRINGIAFDFRGRSHNVLRIGRVYHSGERWMVLNRWLASLDEVPEEEYYHPDFNIKMLDGYPQIPR